MGHTFKLPCGIKNNLGEWTKEIEIDEIDGEAENILLDQQVVKGALVKDGSRRITEVLARCTLRIGDEPVPVDDDGFPVSSHFISVWEKAYANDRGFTSVRLRQISVDPDGDKFVFSHPCPYQQCQKEIKGITVHLNELEVTDMPLEKAKAEVFDLKLPSGKMAQWRMFTGEDEPTLGELRKRRARELSTALIYQRLVSYNGVALRGNKNAQAILKRIKKRELDALRAAFSANEAGIDSRIQVQCYIPEETPDGGTSNAGCGREFWIGLPVDNPDFFFPSATA